MTDKFRAVIRKVQKCGWVILLMVGMVLVTGGHVLSPYFHSFFSRKLSSNPLSAEGCSPDSIRMLIAGPPIREGGTIIQIGEIYYQAADEYGLRHLIQVVRSAPQYFEPLGVSIEHGVLKTPDMDTLAELSQVLRAKGHPLVGRFYVLDRWQEDFRMGDDDALVTVPLNAIHQAWVAGTSGKKHRGNEGISAWLAAQDIRPWDKRSWTEELPDTRSHLDPTGWLVRLDEVMTFNLHLGKALDLDRQAEQELEHVLSIQSFMLENMGLGRDIVERLEMIRNTGLDPAQDEVTVKWLYEAMDTAPLILLPRVVGVLTRVKTSQAVKAIFDYLYFRGGGGRPEEIARLLGSMNMPESTQALLNLSHITENPLLQGGDTSGARMRIAAARALLHVSDSAAQQEGANILREFLKHDLATGYRTDVQMQIEADLYGYHSVQPESQKRSLDDYSFQSREQAMVLVEDLVLGRFSFSGGGHQADPSELKVVKTILRLFLKNRFMGEGELRTHRRASQVVARLAQEGIKMRKFAPVVKAALLDSPNNDVLVIHAQTLTQIQPLDSAIAQILESIQEHQEVLRKRGVGQLAQEGDWKLRRVIVELPIPSETLQQLLKIFQSHKRLDVRQEALSLINTLAINQQGVISRAVRTRVAEALMGSKHRYKDSPSFLSLLDRAIEDLSRSDQESN